MKSLSGLYLVLDPNQNWESTYSKLQLALEAGLGVVQIWNNWSESVDQTQKQEFCKRVKEIADHFKVPVLINEEWILALETELDGVHFDHIPADRNIIKKRLEDKLIGLTVGNELELIQWANENKLSYISFCSVFPSSSVDTCQLVKHETIRQAETLTSLPIFLSGGIKPENLHLLEEFSYQGLAVISGIMNQINPKKASLDYIQKMKNHHE